MAKLLFRLNGVEDDEADAVRDLLNQHEIPFYETSAGRWGFSVAAIWLREEDYFERARELIEEYQEQRREWLRDQPIESWADRFRRKPVTVTISMLAIIGILALSVLPYF